MKNQAKSKFYPGSKSTTSQTKRQCNSVAKIMQASPINFFPSIPAQEYLCKDYQNRSQESSIERAIKEADGRLNQYFSSTNLGESGRLEADSKTIASFLVDHLDQSAISPQEQASRVETVLYQLENGLLEMLKAKANILGKYETQMSYLGHLKKTFLEEQRKKIDELHQYLEDRYLHVVCQYNFSQEKDVLKTKNKLSDVSSTIEECKRFVSKIQHLRQQLLDVRLEKGREGELGLVQCLVRAGKFLDSYQTLKAKKEKHQNSQKQPEFKRVFSQHSNEAKQCLTVDVAKEIDILTKKFRDLNMKQEMVGELVAKYQRGGFKDDRISKIAVKKNSIVSIPRWFSKKMAQYDFDKSIWTSQQVENLDLPLYPFSSIGYCPEMNDYYILGGFNNKVSKKSAFSTRALKVSECLINAFEANYQAVLLPPMKIQRACFPTSVLITKKYFLKEDGSLFEKEKDLEEQKDRQVFEGFVFVAGGKSREDKVTIFCEQFDIKEQKWEQIGSLNHKRLNASMMAFSLDQGLYIFGGEDPFSNLIESIEQYVFASRSWRVLKVEFPIACSQMCLYKVTSRKILILGGLKEVEKNGYLFKLKSKDVFTFNVLEKELVQVVESPLSEPVVSIYPCFQIIDSEFGSLLRGAYMNTQSRPQTSREPNSQQTPTRGKKLEEEVCSIYLINEEGVGNNPSVVAYQVRQFLPGGEKY